MSGRKISEIPIEELKMLMPVEVRFPLGEVWSRFKITHIVNSDKEGNMNLLGIDWGGGTKTQAWHCQLSNCELI